MNQRLKELRKSLGMSQEEFGKLLEVSNTSVADLEAGRRPISDKHLRRLAAYAEAFINTKWLQTGEGDMFLPMDDEEQIRRFVNSVLSSKGKSFKKRLLLVLSQMSDEHFNDLEEFIKKFQ